MVAVEANQVVAVAFVVAHEDVLAVDGAVVAPPSLGFLDGLALGMSVAVERDVVLAQEGKHLFLSVWHRCGSLGVVARRSGPAGLRLEISGKVLQKALASVLNLLPRLLEVAGVPGVVHFLWPFCEVEQEVELPEGIASADGFHVPKVPVVHADEQVEAVIVAGRHLPRPLAFAPDAVFGQLPSGRRIDGIANLLVRSGRRLYVEVLCPSGLLHQVLHHELCHRAAADVAVADEKYAYHNIYILTGCKDTKNNSQFTTSHFPNFTNSHFHQDLCLFRTQSVPSVLRIYNLPAVAADIIFAENTLV